MVSRYFWCSSYSVALSRYTATLRRGWVRSSGGGCGKRRVGSSQQEGGFPDFQGGGNTGGEMGRDGCLRGIWEARGPFTVKKRPLFDENALGSEHFLEFTSRVRLRLSKPFISRHLKLPEHFQNCLPLSTAGDASFFRSGSGEGLSELVTDFPAP